MKHLRAIKLNEPEERIPGMYKTKTKDEVYFKSYNNFYPLYVTTQNGKMEQVYENLNFNQVSDTLLPVVIKCSQLDLEIKLDQFFWFNTNNDFYANLPKRYAWVKNEFDSLKAKKRARGNQLKTEFNIEDWNKKLQIPDNTILNGQNYIVQFNEDELAKIGVYKKRSSWLFNLHTPWISIRTTVGNQVSDSDTVWNTDYYIKYTTDAQGDFTGYKATLKKMMISLMKTIFFYPYK